MNLDLVLLPDEFVMLRFVEIWALVETSGAGTALPAVESKARPLSVTALETSSAGGRGEGGNQYDQGVGQRRVLAIFSCISRTLGVSVKTP